jgi:translation initiation factor 1
VSRRPREAANEPPVPPRNNPFAGLRTGDFPKAEKPAAPPATPAERRAAVGPDAAGSGAVAPRRGKLRVRREKRSKGKVVTVIDGFDPLAEEEVMTLVAALRRDLGVGGLVTEAALELQGDQRQRAAAWLQERGYRVTGDLG